jgi:hypothetical protein
MRHATSFDRVAVVSDEDWMRPALRALSFLLPGKATASGCASWGPRRHGSLKSCSS